MVDEERSLYPAIRQLERGGNSSGRRTQAIKTMIRPIGFLHKDIADAVKMARKTTLDSLIADDACSESSQMFNLLGEVESDVRSFVHKEEFILFPRVIELETSI